MTARSGADALPTYTSIALDCLVRADDFMSIEQLHGCMLDHVGKRAIPLTRNVVKVTLQFLSRHGAVESVLVDGKPWWFATPSGDGRTKIVDRRVPEEPGARRRYTRKPKAKP